MQRLGLVVLFLLAGSVPVHAQSQPKKARAPITVVDATIVEMREAIERGRTTSGSILSPANQRHQAHHRRHRRTETARSRRSSRRS